MRIPLLAAVRLGLLAVFVLGLNSDASARESLQKARPQKHEGKKRTVRPKAGVASNPSDSPETPNAAARQSPSPPPEPEVAQLARIRAKRYGVELELAKLKTQAESALGELDSIDLEIRLAAHDLSLPNSSSRKPHACSIRRFEMFE